MNRKHLSLSYAIVATLSIAAFSLFTNIAGAGKCCESFEFGSD